MDETILKEQAQALVEKVKALVKEGNIARIRLVRRDETVLNLPLNAGIVGTVLGAIAAPWALLVSALVTFGLDCKIELQKTDGSVVDINGKTITGKLADLGETVSEKLKDALGAEDSAVDDVTDSE